MKLFTVVMKDAQGLDYIFETYACTAAKAIIAALELVPGCEISKVRLQEDW